MLGLQFLRNHARCTGHRLLRWQHRPCSRCCLCRSIHPAVGVSDSTVVIDDACKHTDSFRHCRDHVYCIYDRSNHAIRHVNRRGNAIIVAKLDSCTINANAVCCSERADTLDYRGCHCDPLSDTAEHTHGGVDAIDNRDISRDANVSPLRR